MMCIIFWGHTECLIYIYSFDASPLNSYYYILKYYHPLNVAGQTHKHTVLYGIMRPYTDGPIGPLSYRHSSGVVRNPHSTLAE